ncbi:MAG: hypothetical protein Q9166_000308 [cf. Caloplaca sp. 2 TL-2023]
MSAATQKPLGELKQAAPIFSYAQAAKGRSPSGPSSVSMEKTPKADGDADSARNSGIEAQDSISKFEKSPTKRAASEGGQSRSRSIDRKPVREAQSPVHGTSDSSTTPAATTPATQASEKSQVVVSTPSSPEFGVTSASTLPKDDDMFSNANALSDSTWEKLSQGSQTGSKSNDKVEHEKEPTVNGSWDEEASTALAPAVFKEAPPPPVNIWKQRAEAKAAKQPTKPSTTNASGQLQSAAEANGVTKPFDIGAESRRHDSKKQAKRYHGASDEKPATTGTKDVLKPINRRATGEELTEAGPQRSMRVGQIDRSLPTSMPPPPPPGDAHSWPTPDSAQDEKKKAHDRAEKGDKEKTPTARAHGKEKWMPVPYVPTVQFSTPIPTVRRGGRAPRGGRDTAPRGGALSADKARAGSPDASAGSQAIALENGGADSVTSRNPASNPRAKRASSAGPLPARDQRRAGDTIGFDKRKDTGASTQRTESSAVEARRASATTQDDYIRNGGNPADFSTAESSMINGKGPQHHAASLNRSEVASDFPGHPRSAGPERRGEADYKIYGQARDYNGPAPHRERGDGRPDRGRGGYRSRGGSNHAFAHTSIPNGHTAQYPFVPTPMPSKPHSNHERQTSQLHTATYHQSPQNHGRHFRSGSRSQSITHPTSFPRYPQGPHTNPAPQLPNLHTDVANAWGYQPGHQGAMSASPYNAYMEQISIFGMVSMQMEYYFSVDNLCKDLYLRKHMDSQGFVFLSVLAKFNRIRQLTQDLELIRYVCLNSPQIEFRTGSDGNDRLRKRDGWQQWILAIEDRDPSAQNDGPTQVHQPYFPQQPFSEAPYSLDDRQIMPPRFPGSSPHQTSDAIAPPYGSTSPSKQMVNGDVNGGVPPQTPLSAAVPDFAPRLSVPGNTESSALENSPPKENAFTDEQVDLLMIVVRKPLKNPAQMSPPFHSASSRTFSNGSIDGRTIASELTAYDECQIPLGVNGDGVSEVMETRKAQRPRSPFPIGSPQRRINSNVSPPVFWVKDKDTPIDSLPDDLTHEPYNVFRRNALMQRSLTSGGACHYDMDILYQFWSHFLIRNFNARMYQEFRQTAFEDAGNCGSNVGLKNLIQYYNESILGQKVVSDQIASDLLGLVMSEDQKTERPAFDKLRAAWRNGAFNMKNRKKLDSMIDASLKAELER